MIRRPPRSTLFPYTTLFRSRGDEPARIERERLQALAQHLAALPEGGTGDGLDRLDSAGQDRKSTRLNSSHANISYAVFCLKKKDDIVYARTRRVYHYLYAMM